MGIVDKSVRQLVVRCEAFPGRVWQGGGGVHAGCMGDDDNEARRSARERRSRTAPIAGRSKYYENIRFYEDRMKHRHYQLGMLDQKLGE